MRRCLMLAAALCASSTGVLAQGMPTTPAPTVRLTPFVGYRVGFNIEGDQVSVLGSDTAAFAFEEEIGGAGAYGLNVEVPVRGPLGITVAGAFSPSAERTVFVSDGAAFGVGEARSGDMWLARAALSYQFTERMPEAVMYRPWAAAFAGGAWVRLDPEDEGVSAALGEPYNNWGLNVGFHGGAPLFGGRLSFQLGFEDLIIFWNDGEIETRVRRELEAAGTGFDTGFALDSGFSNLFLVRAGLSVSF